MESSFLSSAEILRGEKIEDEEGYVTQGDPGVVGTYPCRFTTPTQGGESIVAGQLREVVTGVFRMPADADVREDDTVRFEGRVYGVVAVLTKGEALRTHINVLVKG